MGLDNGIVLETNSYVNYPFWVKFFDYSKESIEVCYWRKCWGIRNDIISVFEDRPDFKETYQYKVYLEDMDRILYVLRYYMNASNWKVYGHSIFTYKEYWKHLLQQYINCHWLKRYMKRNPKAEVYFYDCY